MLVLDEGFESRGLRGRSALRGGTRTARSTLGQPISIGTDTESSGELRTSPSRHPVTPLASLRFASADLEERSCRPHYVRQ